METEITDSGAKRYDTGKLRYDLVNPDAHEGMIKVLTMGANKYGDRNWEKGMKWSKVIASAKRHLAALEKGIDFDDESGEKHIDHLACNAHFLSAYYKLCPHLDDRPSKFNNPISKLKIGIDIDGVLADFDSHLFGMSNLDPHTIHHWEDPIVNENFNKLKDNPYFWKTLPVLNKPETISFTISAYITARSIDKSITQEWLNTNGFPTAPLYSIGKGQSKVQTAKDAGIELFIDDRFENFMELNNAGIFCYLFDSSHNKKYDVGHKRLYNLSL